MSKQTFIYNNGQNKDNPFNVNKPIVLRSGGLIDPVQVYMMVGDCPDCRPSDIVWEPVYQCGEALELSAENNQIAILIKGRYSIGDPNDPAFVLPQNVNITKQEGVDPSLLGKLSCSTSETSSEVPLTLETSCTNPLFVEICNQTPVETAMAELGCVVDGDGLVVGKVMLCKIIDETTGIETITQTAYYQDGTIENNYVGAWQVCAPESCVAEAFMGVITDLSMLN